MVKPLRILFTAFEPSGDALVEAMARAIAQKQPEVELWGFAGDKAADAGVKLLEKTTEHSAMGIGAASQVFNHKRRLGVLDQWLKENQIDVLVPVDSPAANWSICKLVRKLQPEAKIVHMVLPQIWAWAGWRIHRLRRLSDHVLCMLPFEPDWLKRRGVEGTFIGHPLYDPPPSRDDYAKAIDDWPGIEAVKLGLLPGSRKSEIQRNFPVMMDVASQLLSRHGNLRVKVAMIDEQAKGWAVESVSGRKSYKDVSAVVDFELGKTDAVLAWSDIALVVSGTATLQAAAHRTPMVVCYDANRFCWLFGAQFLVKTRTFALPNLILGGGPDGVVGMSRDSHAIAEYVPHFGEVGPLVESLDELLVNLGKRDRLLGSYGRIMQVFEGKSFGVEAACKLLELVGSD